MSKTRASRLRDLNRRPIRLHLENLEDRVMLTAHVIEDFSSGNLNNYWTEYRYAPSATIVPGATHDGTGNGLDKADGFEWILRNDAAVQVQQGETLSVWTQFAGAVDGRIYFGFGSQQEGLVHSPLSDGHTLALVLAGNTSQFMFMANDTSGGFAPAPHGLGTPVAQAYGADHWYRMEVVWGTDGSLTGNLYDSDGVTLLNTVTAMETQITSGGIAFRGFGSDKYFDAVTADPGNSGSAQYRSRVNNHRLSQTPPPPGGFSGGAFSADGTGTPIPFNYTSVPGSNRDVALVAFNDLHQIGSTVYQIGVNQKVGLSATNVSEVEPTSNQILWGPNSYSGIASSPIIPETPYLAQYLFRQRPGEGTYLIGSSDPKHFFSSARSDFQHLNPGEQDTYDSSLNNVQNYFLSGSDLNPVTGEYHNFDDFGPEDVNGFNVTTTRHYSSRLEHMLQVNVADLDPAQNPPGTRWYLMGNLWVAGDEDVSNNSRWVEIAPQRNGTTFSFTYPHGSSGQFDFHTIPDLQTTPPSVVDLTPYGNTFGLVATARVTFNETIDLSTFTPDQVSLTGPQGTVPITAITPVADSNDRQFDLTFASQTDLGNYALVVGPDIRNLDGDSMLDPFTGPFTIQGPQVVASTPANTATLLGPLGSVRLTFNEPMDPSTFTPDQVDLFLGPHGRIPVTAITPVANSNDTQFDVAFPAQVTTGYYTLVVGPDIYDLYGHAMDQNNNFIPGEVPGDLYTVQFGIQGPRITSSTLANNLNPGVFSLRFTFNEPMDPSTFVPNQVHLQGPGGNVSIMGVSPVAGTNDTQFDIFFAPQNRAGTYQIVVGPNILDQFGNAMDQNQNLITGEIPGDQFSGSFTILGPQITASTPMGSVVGSVDHVRVTFNLPMDVASFTPDQVASFTDPNGNPIPINSVQVVPGSGSKQFDIIFDAQSDYGTYVMIIGPNIDDIYGNPMRAAYQASFSIQAPFYNTAAAKHYHPIEIYGHGGVPVLFTTNGMYYGDDEYGTIDLGSDTFNFAGVTYTGANKLFVSSNGLITFGSGSTLYTNTDLTTSPSQAAIAPLWSDWIKDPSDPGGEMVLAKFATTQKGVRRLIIEWNKVRHVGGNNHLVTFQAILTLDTGSATGAIVFNYVDITTGDSNSDGRTAAIGVKDAGNQTTTMRRLLVSRNQANSLVGSQQAILITYAAGDPNGSAAGDSFQAVPADAGSLAFRGVVSSVSRLEPLPLTGLIRRSRTSGSDLALVALDQVFASTQDQPALSTEITGRPADLMTAADGSDALLDPLEGQRI